MFRCQICKEHVEGETKPVKDENGNTSFITTSAKPTRIVLSYRDKQYPPRSVRCRRHEVDDPGGFGREIEREVSACRPCAESHASHASHAA